jgi:hypothetical protein
MNNEIEFATPAHNLLLKKGVGGEECQVHKNKAANRQTSPQAPWKKHFTPLDLGHSQTFNVAIHNTTVITNSQELEWELNEDSSQRSLLPQGSIGIQVALDQPLHE